MKKELVFERILYEFLEQRKVKLTQLRLAEELGISLSTVNNALKPLAKMGAVSASHSGLKVVDAQKILLYWSSVRNLQKDVVYATRVELPVQEIEKNMPPGIFYTAYSGYKFRYGEVPADYGEVYVYAEGDEALEELRERFPFRRGPANLMVLRFEPSAKKSCSKQIVSDARLYADLWNLGEWYAKDFLKALEARLNL